MGVYIFGTALSVLLAYIAQNLNKTPRLRLQARWLVPKLFVVLSLFPLTFIMAVRRGVGTDYWSYWGIFTENMKGFENGLTVLNRLLHRISNDPQIFFVVTSVFICTAFFIVIYKLSLSPAYSILLFVICKDYFMAMNCVRQYVAIAISLFAIPYIRDRDWKRMLLVTAAAILFHRSAVIIPLLYVFCNITLPPLVAGITVICGFVFSNLISRIIFAVLSRYNLYTKYFLTTSLYRNDERDIFLAGFLTFIAFFLLLTYEYKDVKENKDLKLMYGAVTLSLFIHSISAAMPTTLHRLPWYMDAYLIIYTPEATKRLGNRGLRQLVNASIIILYVIYTSITIWRGNQDVIPYFTIWSR